MRFMLDLPKWVIPAVGWWLAVSACNVATNSRHSSGETGAGGGFPSSGTDVGGAGPYSGATFVGRGCESDLDCGDHPGSFCVEPGENESIFTAFWGGPQEGGGVAGGYCTRRCGPDDPCDAGSQCGGGICLQQCDFGSPTFGQLDGALATDKCWGRDDLMCVPASGGDAVCMPNCGASTDCGGRACDARFGVCTDPDRSGLLDGAQCEPDNSTTSENEDPCSGLCLLMKDDANDLMTTVCTSRCSLGGTGDDCGGLENGACAIPRVEAGGTVAQLGDQGYCASACTSHDGCNFLGGLFCLDLGFYRNLGTGYCMAAQPCEGDGPCDGERVCTETISGPYCLDVDRVTGEPRLPLGAAAL